MVLGIRDHFGNQTGYNQLEPTTNTVNQSTPCVNLSRVGLFKGVAVGDLFAGVLIELLKDGVPIDTAFTDGNCIYIYSVATHPKLHL